MLDSEPDSNYSDLVALAGQLCAAPIALISLVDETRQWFLSRIGTDLTETPRSISFCAHAIDHGDELFEVSDATQDARFSTNPLVTGPLGIRFYAGVPLTLRGGHRLGTLCVMDHRPRTLLPQQRMALLTLARQVVAHLELRRTLGDLSTSCQALEAEAARRNSLERAQRSSARLLRETIDAMQDNIAIVDQAGTITYVNRSWAMFAAANATPAQLPACDVGANYLAVCTKSAAHGCVQAQQVATSLQTALDGRLVPGFRLEYPCHSSTEQRWFVVQISAFDDGSQRLAVINHQNVTQRHLAEQSVRQLNLALEQRVQERTLALAESNQALGTSEARFRSLFENASVSMIRIAPDGRIADVNRACCELAGRSVEQLIGSAIVDRVADAGATRLDRLNRMVFRGDIPGFELDFRIVATDATPVWVRASVTAVSNADGGVESALFLVQNLTRSKTAEYERDRFFELSVDMIALLGFDRKLHRVNPACTRILGYSEDEFLAMTVRELIHPDDRERSTRTFERIAAGEPQPLLDVRLRTRDGDYRHTQWSAAPGAHRQQMIAVGRDITASREADLQAQQSARQLRALAARLQRIREEERTSMSREIHDELGQMLTALKMDLTLLRHDTAAPGKPPERERIIDDLDAMDKLVDATLHSVRRIARQLRPETLDALGLVPAVEWQADEFNARRGAQCEVIAEDDIPDLDADCSTALFRIVQEALTNVVRHADASQVKIVFSQPGQSVRLSIRDDGRGFDSTRTNDSPSLGLLGMRERAMEIGAAFQVRSESGRGCEITVDLPLHGARGAGFK